MLTTLERSKRYVEMAAPETFPLTSNCMSVNLPNRDELSFLTVLAFPKASSKGFDSRTCKQPSLSYKATEATDAQSNGKVHVD